MVYEGKAIIFRLNEKEMLSMVSCSYFKSSFKVSLRKTKGKHLQKSNRFCWHLVCAIRETKKANNAEYQIHLSNLLGVKSRIKC